MKKFHDLNFAVHEIYIYNELFREPIPLSFLQDQLESREIGGGITDFPPLLSLLFQLNLINSRLSQGTTCVLLTSFGKDFYTAGHQGHYHLSHNQINMIIPLYLQSKPHKTRLWFKHLRFLDNCYQCTRSSIPYTLQQLTEDYLFFGIASQQGDCIRLNPNYYWGLSLYQSNLSIEELHEQLSWQEHYGDRATNIALAFEKKRLQQYGYEKLAQNIERLDSEHVNAGYDILSFTPPTLQPNRFIEVKYVGTKEIIYLSLNEIKMAQLLKDQYFIYLITDLDNEGSIIMIQDPINQKEKYRVKLNPIHYEIHLDMEHLNSLIQ